MAYTEKTVAAKNINVGDTVNLNVVKGSLYQVLSKDYDPSTGNYTFQMSSGPFPATRVLKSNSRLVVRKFS